MFLRKVSPLQLPVWPFDPSLAQGSRPLWLNYISHCNKSVQIPDLNTSYCIQTVTLKFYLHLPPAPWLERRGGEVVPPGAAGRLGAGGAGGRRPLATSPAGGRSCTYIHIHTAYIHTLQRGMAMLGDLLITMCTLCLNQKILGCT
jgi:hypothetical protein